MSVQVLCTLQTQSMVGGWPTSTTAIPAHRDCCECGGAGTPQILRCGVLQVINMTNHYLLSVIPLKGANPSTPTVEDGIGVLLRAMQSDYPGNRLPHNPKGDDAP